MNPTSEARVRAAFAALADEIIAAIDADTATDVEPDRLYSIPDAAVRLGGLARSTVYAMIERGELRSVKVGGRRVIPASAIAERAQSSAA